MATEQLGFGGHEKIVDAKTALGQVTAIITVRMEVTLRMRGGAYLVSFSITGTSTPRPLGRGREVRWPEVPVELSGELTTLKLECPVLLSKEGQEGTGP
ncbi:hypothetical protein ACQEVG_34155 [Streptomyces sp. CA-135486]|uniref:hypothetical protein n=1 Tax=Streptomyces sp. CA-135486 TaxID=3240049 RepID=UPI003D92F4FB